VSGLAVDLCNETFLRTGLLAAFTHQPGGYPAAATAVAIDDLGSRGGAEVAFGPIRDG
jgi:hypothetical protein